MIYDTGINRNPEAEKQRKPSAGETEFHLCPPAPLLPCILIAGGLFAASLTLYLSTLAPSVVTLFDDSLEFQLVTYQLGIAHPTGYPLYTILGKLFTFLPFGDVAYRVNLMSAVFGAATVALVYLLILQVARPGKVSDWQMEKGQMLSLNSSLRPAADSPFPWPIHAGGVIGALLLAVGLVFWQQSTIAEVYSLNVFFTAAILLLAATLHLAGPGTKERLVLGLAFLSGLSLTHHRTMLLLLPALAVYLYLTERPFIFKRRTLLLSALLGLLPLLLYLYLPLRGHVGSLDGTYQNTWAGFWRQVSASGYGLFIFDNPFGQERNAAFYWALLKSQFYTTTPGFIGIFYLLWLGQRRMLALTGVAFLTYTGFNLFYNVSDIEVFFIPPFLLWAVWSGAGVAFLLSIAATLKYHRWRPVLAITILAIFAFIIFQLFRANYTILRASYNWEVHDYGVDILQQPLPPAEEPAIVGILGEMTLLRYFQQTENRRPDIKTVAADLEADRLATVEKLLAGGQAVYLTRELPGAPERWSLYAVGPLIRVNPKPITIPPEFSFDLEQAITPEIKVLGYNLSRPPHTGPGPSPVRLTLYWQAAAPLSAGLKVSARLLNQAGEPLAVVDAVPVHFAYPTTAWRPGEIVSDVYDLVLPVDAPPGQYKLLLIWYDPAQNAVEVGRIELGSITID